jgi:predicted MFS family arabinose efflux permease
MNKSNSIKIEIYVSWAVLAIFYLYQYILRSSPGVLIEEVRHTFNMNAAEFSLMGVMYYGGYSLMQIPLGIVIDRKGIRKTVIWSIILCIFGTLILTVTSSSLVAYISRFIVGLGSASAFMSSLKLSSDYLPSSKQGIAMGATLTAGSMGALITGSPLNYLLDHFSSWQMAFVVFSILGILILLLAFLYIPLNKNLEVNSNVEYSDILFNLKKVINNKKILVYAFIAIGLFTPLSVTADLWGTAFLVTKFNLTRELASPILMNIYIGMAIGSIALPYLTTRINIDKVIKFSSLILLLLFSTLVYVDNLKYDNLVLLLIFIGFFCGAEMLCFTAALKHTMPNISGLTIGVVNTLNMLSGAIMQQVIGYYLDFTWSGALDGYGLRIYSTSEFVEAFSILVVIIAICTITAFLNLDNNKKI